MLGLAGGTDTLGACLQFAGLIVAAGAVARLAPTLGDRVFGSLLVLGCPIMLFLGLTQKFQLLPAAATTLALSIMVRRAERFDVPQMTLAFGGVAFAIETKTRTFDGQHVAHGAMLVAAFRGRRGARGQEIAPPGS